MHWHVHDLACTIRSNSQRQTWRRDPFYSLDSSRIGLIEESKRSLRANHESGTFMKMAPGMTVSSIHIGVVHFDVCWKEGEYVQVMPVQTSSSNVLNARHPYALMLRTQFSVQRAEVMPVQPFEHLHSFRAAILRGQFHQLMSSLVGCHVGCHLSPHLKRRYCMWENKMFLNCSF